MSDETIDEHAEMAWNSRIIASPDNWRNRATNAAGLTSAAAAAAVAGVLLTDRTIPGAAVATAAAAAVAYVLAILVFLVAIVWPSKDRSELTDKAADTIYDLCEEEARPIRRAVRLGCYIAAAAVAATGVTLVLAAQEVPPEEHPVEVVLMGAQTQAAVAELCPAATSPIRAVLIGLPSETVKLRLPEGECELGVSEAVLTLRTSDVLVRQTAE